MVHPVKQKPLRSSLASLASREAQRDAIVDDSGPLNAALTFIEGTAAGWRDADVVQWFLEHLVVPGRMAPPGGIYEPPMGVVSLELPDNGGGARAMERVLEMARARVIRVLRAFTVSPPDDGFLKSAIYAGRVQRRRVDDRAAWVARPRETDPLSDIVLSLFVADILTHREFHEAMLCICDVCGRMSFDPVKTTRSRCVSHPPHGETTSGFMRNESKGQSSGDDTQG